MSELKSKSADASLVVGPIEVAERGSPTWLRVKVTLQDRSNVTHEVVSLTTGDVRDLCEGLREAESSADSFEFDGQDETFQLRVKPAPNPVDAFVGLWLGEPYGVMRGFRIVVDRKELTSFAETLEREAASATGRGG